MFCYDRRTALDGGGGISVRLSRISCRLCLDAFSVLGVFRLLPPVTRELLEKCIFMLKLASDDEDEEVVRNVMFFFERLVNG